MPLAERCHRARASCTEYKACQHARAAGDWELAAGSCSADYACNGLRGLDGAGAEVALAVACGGQGGCGVECGGQGACRGKGFIPQG